MIFYGQLIFHSMEILLGRIKKLLCCQQILARFSMLHECSIENFPARPLNFRNFPCALKNLCACRDSTCKFSLQSQLGSFSCLRYLDSRGANEAPLGIKRLLNVYSVIFRDIMLNVFDYNFPMVHDSFSEENFEIFWAEATDLRLIPMLSDTNLIQPLMMP